MSGIFYVVEADLPAEALPGFVDWYGGVHAPHLFQAGFTTCTSYGAIAGGFPVVDIYQGPDWSLFESANFARYRPIAVNDPHRPEALGRVRNLRTVYTHRACLEGEGVGDPDWLDTDWITIWRFGGDASVGKRSADWLALAGGGALAAAGARKVRLIERTRDAPTGTSHRPNFALVAEWGACPSTDVQAGGPLPDWLVTARSEEDGFFTGVRLFPWAEVAEARGAALDLIGAARS